MYMKSETLTVLQYLFTNLVKNSLTLPYMHVCEGTSTSLSNHISQHEDTEVKVSRVNLVHDLGKYKLPEN